MEELQNQTKEINTVQEAEAEVVRRNINPDVFNALNLYDEKLGEEHEKEGYNPFEPDFKLTKEFAQEVLEHKPSKQDIPKEDFLEVGAKKATSYFKNTLAAGEKLIEKLEGKMGANGLDMSTIHQIQRAIIFLKNRNQLLKRNIRELKFRNANALQMFTDMYVLDKELSDLLKETYETNVDIDAILNQFVEVCKTRAKINIEKRQKRLQKELKEKRDWEEAMRDSMDRMHDQTMADLAFLANAANEVVDTVTGGHHHDHHGPHGPHGPHDRDDHHSHHDRRDDPHEHRDIRDDRYDAHHDPHEEHSDDHSEEHTDDGLDLS